MKKRRLILVFEKVRFRIGMCRFRSIRIFLSKFSRFLYSHFYFDVQGHTMFLDSEDTLKLADSGIFDPLETELFNAEIKKNDVVLDIGANIGYYTLIAAKLVGENGVVFAFEPEPTNFALLKRNVEINGYKNVILVQKAVSNKTGKVKLYLSERNLGDHRIYNSQDGRQSIEIEAIRLDDYFKDYNGKIDFIKMDVQGSEGGVFQGGSRVLKKNKDVKVVTEFWPVGLKRFGIDAEEYLKLIIEHGFQIYEINEPKQRMEPINISKLLGTYTPEKENYTNLLCIRENKQVATCLAWLKK